MNPETGEKVQRGRNEEAEKESFRKDFIWVSKLLGGELCSLTDSQIFT